MAPGATRRRRAGRAGAALALIAAACGQGAAPPAPPAPVVPPAKVEAAAAPAAPLSTRGQAGLSVEVRAGAGAEGRGVAGVEVRLLGEEELAAHLARRRASSAAAARALRDEAARLDAERERLRAENDAANQAWMRSAGDSLRDRAALNLRPQGSAADVGAAQRAIAKRRLAARAQASAAAHAALAAEERAAAVRAELARLQRESFLRALPAGAGAARTDPQGRLRLELPPGRWVAVGVPPPGARRGPWLATVELAPGAEVRLLLDDASIPELEL